MRSVVGAAVVLAFTPPQAESTLRVLVPPGVRVVPQRGDGLGDRLTHLFDDLLGRHAVALVLDADSPTLPMAWVAAGLATLAAADADVVLGPAEDGGYWGIGLRAPCPGTVVQDVFRKCRPQDRGIRGRRGVIADAADSHWPA